MNAAQTHMKAFSQVEIDLLEVLAKFPAVTLAVLFGSVATQSQSSNSDLDIAVFAGRALSAQQKMALMAEIAQNTGRPVDLIDLSSVAEPLLGQIVRKGKRLLGSDVEFGKLISRHLMEQADFMPYQSRLLAERRAAWIGK